MHFDVPPGAATPDDIWDYVISHSGEFVRVGALERIPAQPAA